ncbi:hypothetical protein BGP_4845 [Beggiatoa sp. PS]|nr:hypothetical protein BGP_4845 [Beggiatoa sp. PS]
MERKYWVQKIEELYEQIIEWIDTLKKERILYYEIQKRTSSCYFNNNIF